MNARTTNPVASIDADDADVLALIRAAFQHARSGEVAPLAALVDAGVPIDIKNEKGDTLLMLAAYHGHVDDHVAAIELLLARGAAKDRADAAGVTALALARGMGVQRAAALLASSP